MEPYLAMSFDAPFSAASWIVFESKDSWLWSFFLDELPAYKRRALASTASVPQNLPLFQPCADVQARALTVESAIIFAVAIILQNRL